MTGTIIFSVYATASGRFKVYATGHADGHLMDWAGSNYRHVPVGGQPFRGFETFEEAEALMKRMGAKEERTARGKPGSWLPEDRHRHRCLRCREVISGPYAHSGGLECQS